MPNPLFDTLFAPLAQQSRPLLHLANGQTITAKAFHAMVCLLANALLDAGVQPGERVAAQVAK